MIFRKVGLMVFLVIATLGLSVGANQASAVMTFDLKATTKDFKPGKITDVPVFLVENRSHKVESELKGMAVKQVFFNYVTLNSRFVRFKPVAGFGGERQEITIGDNGRYLNVALVSDKGKPVKIDNSGITGRTEVKLGTLRVKPGKPTGKKGSRTFFETELGGDASGYNLHVVVGERGTSQFSGLGTIFNKWFKYREGEQNDSEKCWKAKGKVAKAKRVLNKAKRKKKGIGKAKMALKNAVKRGQRACL